MPTRSAAWPWTGIGSHATALSSRPTEPLPITLEDTFVLEHETQTEARIVVVQGAAGALLEECLNVGEVILDGLPPSKQKAGRIKIAYGYNVEGILSVTATDTLSGKSTNGVIHHRAGVTRQSDAA